MKTNCALLLLVALVTTTVPAVAQERRSHVGRDAAIGLGAAGALLGGTYLYEHYRHRRDAYRDDDENDGRRYRGYDERY